MQNLSTIIVCLILLAAFISAIVYLIKNRKKSSCGDCAGCAMRGNCHSEKKGRS